MAKKKVTKRKKKVVRKAPVKVAAQEPEAPPPAAKSASTLALERMVEARAIRNPRLKAQAERLARRRMAAGEHSGSG